MRAGLLRELITFEEPATIVTPSGFSRKEFVPVLTTKAYRRRISTVGNTDMNANEEFIGNTIVFQVRKNPLIDENKRIVYQGTPYKIRLIDPQFSDSTFIITCTKIND